MLRRLLSIPAAKRANFVRRVALFCLEGTFFDETVAFIEAKSHHFVRDAREREGKSNEGEHKLVFSAVHREFCDTFEEKIETYIREQGYAPKDLYRYISMAKEDDRDVSMLDVFLSAFDYATFHDLASDPEKLRYWRGVLAAHAEHIRRAMPVAGK
jgi:hypothetical protein